VKLVIWDMDGTLIDSAFVVPDAFVLALESAGVSGYTRDQIIDLYKLGVPENLIGHVLGETPSSSTMDSFYSQLEQNSHKIKVYEGIVHCLEDLGTSTKLAVFTGASQRSAEILLKALGLDSHFDTILGGDNHPPKPDPSALVTLCSDFDLKPNQCVYVGDADADIEAANRADMISVSAGWGHLYSDSSQARFAADTPSDLSKFVLESQ